MKGLYLGINKMEKEKVITNNEESPFRGGEVVKRLKLPFRGWGYLGLKKLDVYIIKKFFSTFFFAIMVLAVISCVIDYSEKVDNIVSKKAPLAAVKLLQRLRSAYYGIAFSFIYFHCNHCLYFQDRV